MRIDTEKPLRGRPRGFDAEAALARAAARFRVTGYAGTSLDDLVAATGVNRPSLYAAYGDKQAMYLAALGQMERFVDTGFDRLLAAPGDVRARLMAFFAYDIDLYLDGQGDAGRGCIATGTAAAEAVASPAVAAALARILRLIDTRLTELFGGMSDAPARAKIAAATMHSLSIRARAGATRAELEEVAAAAVALLA